MSDPFRPLRPLTVRWIPAVGQGLQHVDIRPAGDGLRVDGMAIGNFEGRDFGARFRVDLDTGWRTRRLVIETTDGRGLDVASDEPGRWRDGAGNDLPRFDGCIDIDLSGSPFTNTLPIRRLNLTPESGPTEFTVLWVPFDSFDPFPDGQRYTALSPRRFLFEAVDGAFSDEITVDDDGLVVEYPKLFARA